MPMRHSVVKDQETLADSTTTTIDLSKNDWVSGILIEFYATNGGTNNQDAHPHDIISSIQVVDGSYILKSLSGVEAAALYLYNHGVVPPETLDETLSVVQRYSTSILFGRYLGDPLFAINAKDFENLQLKITHNLATIRAVGATGYLTTTGRLSCDVLRFEDMELTPLGWIKTEQKNSYTSAAAGVKEIDLPTDNEWRRIMFRSFITNNTIGHTVFDVNMGDGKFMPYSGHRFRWIRQDNRALYKICPEVFQRIHKQDTDTVELNIYESIMGGLRGMGTGDDIVSLTENYGLATMSLTSDAGAAIVADQPIDVACKGDGYQNTHMIPMDLGGEFLDASKWGSGVLKATQSGVTRAATVVLEEIIRGRGKFGQGK